MLAGDIGSGTRGLDVVERVREAYDTVIYVAGNHEYYKHATPRLDAKLRARADALGVTFLENESAIVGGARILGCTFWTDFELFAPAIPRHVAIAAAESRMADFRAIRVSPEYRRLRTEDVRALHSGSRDWLRQELTRTHDGPTIVVTHHAPLLDCTAPRHRADALTAAFASDQSALITSSEIACWIHGHTHHRVDVEFGGTRIVSNQRGYPGEDTGGFDPAFVVDVDG